MKILAVTSLAIPEVRVIRIEKFVDHRGYFVEHFRRTELGSHEFLRGYDFVQANASFSKAGTVRGLHFQWNPLMGKLVRTVHGHMVDLLLDVRKASPSFGHLLAYDMPATGNYLDMIWIPPGFAHGNFFPRDSHIEYLCTGEYNAACEAAISPLAPDIDWSLCPKPLALHFAELATGDGALMSDKDRCGLSVAAWDRDPRSANLLYGRC